MLYRFLVFICLGLMPLAAYADLEGSNALSSPAAQETSPLLVIRFNQKHVYFERALQQAVSAAERAKPNVVYRLVSYVPAAEGEHASQSNAANARAVIDAMLRDGVPQSRIGFSTQALESGDSQEVRIYVK